MPAIIAVNLIEEEYDFPTYYKYISRERIKKINSYHFNADAKRSLIAALLARYMICNELQVTNDTLIFSTDKNGKPHLIGSENCYFNVSHSDNKVVCIIDDKSNGIDVEKIQKCDFDIVRQFFHDQEYKDFERYTNANRDEFFTFLWTMKEAYLKSLGVGLSKELSSFHVQKTNDNQIRIIDGIQENTKMIYKSIITKDHFVISYVAHSTSEITNITDQMLFKLVRESVFFDNKEEKVFECK